MHTLAESVLPVWAHQPERFVTDVMVPVTRWMDRTSAALDCPRPKGSWGDPRALRMLLAIGMVESGLRYRVQRISRGGRLQPAPHLAAGLFQFERNGVAAVLTNAATRQIAGLFMNSLHVVDVRARAIHSLLIMSDEAAVTMARLLLWASPIPLPKMDSDAEVGYAAYIDAWRPGRPRRTAWARAWKQSGEVMGRLPS